VLLCATLGAELTNRTSTAERIRRPAEQLAEIEQRAVELSVGSWGAREVMQIKAKLVPLPNVSTVNPRAYAGGVGVHEDCATLESEAEHRLRQVVTHTRNQSQRK
jgi:hypothetical protein